MIFLKKISENKTENIGFPITLITSQIELVVELCRLHGRVVKGVGHLGHVEVMEAGGREFDPRPGRYTTTSF